jgi:putative GTP pyrophosphokinase
MPIFGESSPQLPPKDKFLKEHRIAKEDFLKDGLDWSDLKAIFRDYSKWHVELKPMAECLAAVLRECPGVHAVKSRVKAPEKLIAKVIRRSIRNGQPWATSTNFLRVVPDLIGIRALILFHEHWPAVNQFIRQRFPVKKQAEAYLQKPTPEHIRSMLESGGCKIEEGKIGYQSVHFEMSQQVGRRRIRVEIQTRTLYEEAWGEVSHATLYPYRSENAKLIGTMLTLAELVVKADHFSSVANDLAYLLDDKKEGGRNRARIARFQQLVAFLKVHYPESENQLADVTDATSTATLGVSDAVRPHVVL